MIGLILLVAGLVFQFNGTEWFDGEEGVGNVLLVVGAVLVLASIIWSAIVGRMVKKQFDDFPRFGR